MYYSLLTTYYLLFTPGAAVAVNTYFIVLTTYHSHYTYTYYSLLTTYYLLLTPGEDVDIKTSFILLSTY